MPAAMTIRDVFIGFLVSGPGGAVRRQHASMQPPSSSRTEKPGSGSTFRGWGGSSRGRPAIGKRSIDAATAVPRHVGSSNGNRQPRKGDADYCFLDPFSCVGACFGSRVRTISKASSGMLIA